MLILINLIKMVLFILTLAVGVRAFIVFLVFTKRSKGILKIILIIMLVAFLFLPTIIFISTLGREMYAHYTPQDRTASIAFVFFINLIGAGLGVSLLEIDKML